MSDETTLTPQQVLILRAWNDEEFHKKLVADPAGALAEAGIKLQNGVTLSIHRNTAEHQHLVIPMRPDETR